MTGNLKLDVPAPPVDAGKLAAMRAVVRQRPVIAAASTHPGEEAVIIDAHRRLRQSFPGLLTIIAPRHPERGPGVVEIATAAGLNAVARSRGLLPDRGTDVYVADTIGELGLIYRLAPIVFMGGSLVRHGGQNPIEAAKLGAAILHGPHVWNFAEIYAALDEAHGAEEVLDANKLAVRIGAWLTDAAARKQVADAGLATVDQLGGALRPHARGARALSDAARSGATLTMRAPASGGSKPGALRPALLSPLARDLRRRRGAAAGAAGRARRRPGDLHRQSDRRRRRQDADRDRDRATADRCGRTADVPHPRLWRKARRTGAGRAGAHRRAKSATSRCCSRASRRPIVARDRVAGARHAQRAPARASS